MRKRRLPPADPPRFLKPGSLAWTPVLRGELGFRESRVARVHLVERDAQLRRWMVQVVVKFERNEIFPKQYQVEERALYRTRRESEPELFLRVLAA